MGKSSAPKVVRTGADCHDWKIDNDPDTAKLIDPMKIRPLNNSLECLTHGDQGSML
jgi:hypothetical protein